MIVYALVTFEYNTYSYSGVSQKEIFIHLTKDGAIKHATKLGLVIVRECEKPHDQAEIEEMEVLT